MLLCSKMMHKCIYTLWITCFVNHQNSDDQSILVFVLVTSTSVSF